MKRREILKMGLGVTGVVAAGLGGQAIAAVCTRTPAQTKGPFYPLAKPLDVNTDLTHIEGQTDVAKGSIVYIRGVVTDQACMPVESALVEIWQACHTGKYNHPGDPNPAELDPNFQYFGRALTNGKGEYSFKTIIPGAYPADVDWMRPAHIHYKISKKGYHELVTQMYFDGDQYNATDLILQQLSKADQASVVVKLNPAELGMEPTAQVGEFNISLRKVQPIV